MKSFLGGIIFNRDGETGRYLGFVLQNVSVANQGPS